MSSEDTLALFGEQQACHYDQSRMGSRSRAERGGIMQREVADCGEVFLGIQGLVDSVRAYAFALCETGCRE